MASLVVATSLVLTVAPEARAAVHLELGRTSGYPGQVVRAEGCCPKLPVFFVSDDLAPAGAVRMLGPPTGASFIPLGNLDGFGLTGQANLSFFVPRTVPGLYRLVVFCGSCVPGPEGSLITASEPFRVLAGKARALWLTFNRKTAAPGERVAVRTDGQGVIKLHGKRTQLRLYLAPLSAAASITSLRDRRLVLLGELELKIVRPGFADGRLRFTVPNVRPGNYTTLVHCALCARDFGGRDIVPGGPSPGSFRVVRTS